MRYESGYFRDRLPCCQLVNQVAEAQILPNLIDVLLVVNIYGTKILSHIAVLLNGERSAPWLAHQLYTLT